jgi:HD-GYP domain-containing protein (c-di-GMP phosphodiesterase class II)
MTSARSYRGARGIDEALEEVRRCSGGHFWPAAAEALLRLAESGLLEGVADPVGARSVETD